MTAAGACWVLVLAVAALAGCKGVLPEPDFERMMTQRNFRPYVASPESEEQSVMRPPPPGTVSRDRIIGRTDLTQGKSGDAYATASPVPITRALLERGRDRFEITCAACHGIRGDGVSQVARHMSMRKPPSLLDRPVNAFPPGRIFNVITFGYGLMPAYDTHLSLTDRWATVAYVRALQLSQRAPLDALPADVRAEAEAALR